MARLLGWLLALLAVITWAGLETTHGSPQPQIVAHAWRRTTAGWEWRPRWRSPLAEDPTLFHPLVLASLQLAVSLLALSSGAEDEQSRAAGTCPVGESAGASAVDLTADAGAVPQGASC